MIHLWEELRKSRLEESETKGEKVSITSEHTDRIDERGEWRDALSCQRRTKEARLGAVSASGQQGAEVRCREWEVTAQCHTAHRVSPQQAGREQKKGETERRRVDRETKRWEICLKLFVFFCISLCQGWRGHSDSSLFQVKPKGGFIWAWRQKVFKEKQGL